MPYDIYKCHTDRGMGGQSIEEKVLADLERYTDRIDRLEVLDSYKAFIERDHQRDLANRLANLLFRSTQPILEDLILARMPGSTPSHRGRPVIPTGSADDSKHSK